MTSEQPMSGLLDPIARRRSIRRFTDEPVARDVIDLLLEAGRRAPSAVNLQHLRVRVVDTPAERALLASAAYGSPTIANAPVVLLCMADLSASDEVVARITELREAGALEGGDASALVSGAGRPFELRTGADVAAIDAAIGVAYMELQAASLGLGCCWVHHADYEQIAEEFALPATMRVVTLLALGHPAEDPAPRPRIPSIEWPSD